MPVEIIVYAGFDWRSRLAVEAARQASLVLVSTYGIEAPVDVVELPYGDLDAGEAGLPEVRVEGKIVARGRVPHIDEILDAAFEVLEERFPGAWKALLWDEEGEKGLLGV